MGEGREGHEETKGTQREQSLFGDGYVSSRKRHGTAPLSSDDLDQTLAGAPEASNAEGRNNDSLEPHDAKNDDDDDLTVTGTPDADVTQRLSIPDAAVRPLGERAERRSSADDDRTLDLPSWRDPPTGEIPRIIEQLAGEPLPRVHADAPENFDALESEEPRSVPQPFAGGHAATEDDVLVPVDPQWPPVDDPYRSDPDDTDARSDDGFEGLFVDHSTSVGPEAPADQHNRSLSISDRQQTSGSPDVAHEVSELSQSASRAGSAREAAQGMDPDVDDSFLRSGRPGDRRSPSRHEVVSARTRRQRKGSTDQRATSSLSERDKGQEGAEPALPAPPYASSERSAETAQQRGRLVRTVTGVVLALVFLGALKLGSIPTLVVVVVAITTAAGEGYNLLRKGGYRPAPFVGLLGVAGSVVGAYIGGEGGLVLALVACAVLALVWFLVLRNGQHFLLGVAATLVMVGWVGLFGSFAGLLLRRASFGGDGLGLLIGVLLCATGADVLAFFGGSLVGKHKLAPSISPGKTIEGVLIGGVASVLIGAFALPLLHPYTFVAGLFVGVIAAVLTPVGDLAESALKRSVAAKDSSRLLPGHGGMLDRIDGILIVLPAAFYLFLSLHLR